MNWYKPYKRISCTRFLEIIDQEEDSWIWAVKRLSGNDTGLTGGHQSGIYLPQWFFESAFPEICTTETRNPKSKLSSCYFPNYDDARNEVVATYYNSKFFPDLRLKKPYDEFRITGWGGRNCALQDVENTGSLMVIACRSTGTEKQALVWVCTTVEEEALVESWLGLEVSPSEVYGQGLYHARAVTDTLKTQAERCVQPEWLSNFPSGADIFNEVVNVIPSSTWSRSIDELLLCRRALEFAIFEQIEKSHVLPKVTNGFTNVDDFLSLALSIANRRKARTGFSLELNLAEIFTESKLQFEMQAVTEMKKRPDFLFPSHQAYHTPSFPDSKLHMLAAKTCCKERWRQVLSEADRISRKHLFTLQEGVSENQLKEMEESGIILVVPEPNKKAFPKNVRSNLKNLDNFVEFIGNQQNASSCFC